MSQNQSSAVMQRRSEPHDSLDDFPTPPWATRALCDFLQNQWDELLEGDRPPHAPTTWPMTVRDPAANRGYMVRPLCEYFHQVDKSDVHDYGMGYALRDYLFPGALDQVDWTITNPPFKLAEAFIDRALKSSRMGVAVIVRSAFLEGEGRYKRLFSKCPPTDILQFCERVVMHKGRVPDPNVAVLNENTGKMAKPSTATAYTWLIWDLHSKLPSNCAKFNWIAPCRRDLEQPEDYDVWPKGDAKFNGGPNV